MTPQALEVTPQALDHPEPSIPSNPKTADAAAKEDTPQQTPPAEAEGEVTPQQTHPQTPKQSPALKHPVVEQTPDSEKEKGTPIEGAEGASPIAPTASASNPRSATPIASNSPMPKDDEMTQVQQPAPSEGTPEAASPSKRRRLNPGEEDAKK